MTRYLDGEARAFKVLARRMEPRIRRMLRRRVREFDDVDDLVQQTFLRVHQSRARYDRARVVRESSVEQWFLTVARRCALDHLRAELRRDRRQDVVARAGDAAGFGGSAPSLDFETRLCEYETRVELRRRVREAVDTLPTDSAEVVRRHKLQGQPMHAIADELGLRPGTVRVRAHRAYQTLATLLEPLP